MSNTHHGESFVNPAPTLSLGGWFADIISQQPTKDQLKADQENRQRELDALRSKFEEFTIFNASLLAIELNRTVGVTAAYYSPYSDFISSTIRVPAIRGYELKDMFKFGAKTNDEKDCFETFDHTSMGNDILPYRRKLIVTTEGEIAIAGDHGQSSYLINPYPLTSHWYNTESISSEESAEALKQEVTEAFKSTILHYVHPL